MKRLLGSIILLATIATILTALAVVAITPAAAYVTRQSVSLTGNFYAVGGIVGLVVMASVTQGLLAIRLIWGPAVSSSLKEPGKEEDDFVEMRAMRVTGTKKAVVITLVLVVNMVVFDQLAEGMLLTDTRAIRVLTLLRSEHAQDRADAVNDAILLTGDKRISKALKEVISTPGESREWAAYTAGARHDDDLSDSLILLLQTGNERERAAAATALARLKDDRLIGYAEQAYNKADKLKGDIVVALGMLGSRTGTSKGNLATAGNFLSGLLKNGNLDEKLIRVVIWALGRFRAPEGLLPLETLLQKPGDNGTLCTGLEALGRIGSASTSPKLIKTIYEMDRNARCPELVYRDFTGHEVLICSGINIIERLLHEIAHIGDRRARSQMEELSKDMSFSKQVRNLAAEIAFQMKYKPVTEPEPGH